MERALSAVFGGVLSGNQTGDGLSLSQLRVELLSGLTVALALVPEAVAFAFVAGVHPLVGLYAAFIVGLITMPTFALLWSVTMGTGALNTLFFVLFTRFRLRARAPSGKIGTRLLSGEVQDDEVEWDPGAGRVRAFRRRRLGALVIAEAPLADPPAGALAAALVDGIRATGLHALPWSKETRQLRERIARYQEELEAERARRLARSQVAAQPQSLPVGAQEDDLTGLPLPLEL